MDKQQAATLVENGTVSIEWLVKQQLITKALGLVLLNETVYSEALVQRTRVSIQMA